ncbi:MAG: DUF4124 domain-containing protein [Gammaproteobacteria bacterium]
MLIRFQPVALLSLFLSTVLFSQPAAAKKLYRWVDENGKTYLSDQVPPEHAQYRRESLSKKGAVIEVTEQTKTQEQRALEKRLENVKKAREQIIAKQKDLDRVLLSNYRSIDDMNLALHNKMHAFDIKINLLRDKLNALESRMETRLKEAADRERNGEKITEALVGEVKSIKTQIEKTKQQIAEQLKQKEIAKAEFEEDIKRYQFLTQSGAKDSQTLSDQTAEILAADTLGLFPCLEKSECGKAWEIARRFVKANSTTPIDSDDENLMMAQEPAKDDDLSLSISKIGSKAKKQQIFLDIRCRQSSSGDELCASEKVKEIRTSFRSYIESGLNGGNGF